MEPLGYRLDGQPSSPTFTVWSTLAGSAFPTTTTPLSFRYKHASDSYPKLNSQPRHVFRPDCSQTFHLVASSQLPQRYLRSPASFLCSTDTTTKLSSTTRRFHWSVLSTNCSTTHSVSLSISLSIFTYFSSLFVAAVQYPPFLVAIRTSLSTSYAAAQHKINFILNKIIATSNIMYDCTEILVLSVITYVIKMRE